MDEWVDEDGPAYPLLEVAVDGLELVGVGRVG
jgi:hypothetical protein